MRQLDGEVAPALGGLPAADPPPGLRVVGTLVALAEHPYEARQPVVPVMVAREREHPRRRRVGVGPLRAIRPERLVLVRLHVAVGVDLVASHHEQPPRRRRVHRPLAAIAQGERAAGEVGDRRRGVEAVADVADVVDPQLVRFGLRGDAELGEGERVHREQRLLLPLVGEGPEQPARPQVHADAGEHARAEPLRGRLAPEAELALGVVGRAPARRGRHRMPRPT